jgi:hypothetical protein
MARIPQYPTLILFKDTLLSDQVRLSLSAESMILVRKPFLQPLSCSSGESDKSSRRIELHL